MTPDPRDLIAVMAETAARHRPTIQVLQAIITQAAIANNDAKKGTK